MRAVNNARWAKTSARRRVTCHVVVSPNVLSLEAKLKVLSFGFGSLDKVQQ